MNGSTRHRAALWLRWTARLWSLATILVIAALIVGEGINPSNPGEAVGLVFYPLGICAGMIVAWWRERLGGVITVASLIIFYAIHVATAGRLPAGWAWIVLAMPGFLFLLASRTASEADKPQSPKPKAL
jgi:hypothetical protein